MTLESFQNWVIQTGLMVSLLIVLILVIRRPFAKTFGANAAYALWSLPLIRLFLPAFSVPQNWVPEFMQQTPDLDTVPTLPAFEFPAPDISEMGENSVLPAPTYTAGTEVFHWEILVVGLWLFIAVTWLSYQMLQQFRFKSFLEKGSALPNAELLAQIDRASVTVGLSKRPKVRVAMDQTGPLVTGVVNPLVIVPNNFTTMFDRSQQHFALVHEFAHIKRRDLWVALTTLIFRAVNWPNPIVHYAAHKMRGDQEAACDAFVVKVTGGETAHSYAETLVKAVREDGREARPNMHLALSLTDADSEISKGD